MLCFSQLVPLLLRLNISLPCDQRAASLFDRPSGNKRCLPQLRFILGHQHHPQKEWETLLAKKKNPHTQLVRYMPQCFGGRKLYCREGSKIVLHGLIDFASDTFTQGEGYSNSTTTLQMLCDMYKYKRETWHKLNLTSFQEQVRHLSHSTPATVRIFFLVFFTW